MALEYFGSEKISNTLNNSKMNIRKYFLLALLLVASCNLLIAKEVKLPLEMKSGHLNSVWQLSDSIETKVFLETGFPKIVISESFAKMNLLGKVHTQEASENAYIALWGNNNKVKVLYHINDSLIINGKKEKIDALVADFSTIKSWNDYHVIYPLRDLTGAIEINISNKYMIVDKCLANQTSDFIKFKAKSDEDTKGLYITTTLQLYDTLKTKEKLKGNFLLDLGAGNAMFLNRNLKKVEKFVSKSERMLLKDTTKYKPNAKTKLAIIKPKTIQFGSVALEDNYIVAMKMFKSAKSNRYVGMLGNKFFSNFIVIFDFKNNVVYMKPNTHKVRIIK